MTTIIPIPAHSVVLILGGKRAPLAELADRLTGHTAVPWDVNHPDAAREALHEALRETTAIRTVMLRSNARARRDVASIARKRGAETIVLRLPGAEDVDAVAEKISAVHDVPDVESFAYEIVPMPSDLRARTGPFDIIGDIHGAADELVDLLERLGYEIGADTVLHPDGRVPVLLGDLTDRGPQNKRALEIARTIDRSGGLVILGNHCRKLSRWLRGKNVEVKAGLAITIAELERESETWRLDMADWLDGLQTHYVLDGGALVVAHAGLPEEFHGRHTGGAVSHALYGKKAPGNLVDEEGYPIAEDWAQDYAGAATVVHGHVVYAEPRIVNNVVAIDTGATFGGRLTAYRWPERDFVSVPARAVYFEPRGEPS